MSKPIVTMQPASHSDGRARILHSAIGLFAQRGYSAVSISDVAQAAGVVKSAIYHHFPSKDALYLAVLRETVRQSREQMEASAHGETWSDRLRGVALAVGRLVGPQSHVFSIILEGMAQNSPKMDPTSAADGADLRRQFVSAIAQEIRTGIAAGDLNPIDPDLGGLCLIGLIAAALQATPNVFEPSQVTFAVDLFLRGAARRVPEPPSPLPD